MSTDWRAGLGQFVIALFLGGVTVPCWESIVLAQIIPDETLGDESSVVTPDNIKGIESDLISGGAVRGNNLFHSFQEFNIGEGRGGYFNNPAAIENIFSRVTGSNSSKILGTLGVLGNANLFLLNPNGIIFGNNASLDLRGSFLATTADSILFPDSNQFSATNPEAPPLLTVNMPQPIGLEFQGRERTISHQGDLAVDSGQNLALLGGNLIIDGGKIVAPGGRLELGGLSAAGEISINTDGSLSFPEGIERADVTLTNAAEVDVRAGDGGSITINAGNIELSGGELGASNLRAGIAADSRSSTAQAGNITLNATDTITVSQGSGILNQVEESGVGDVGGINLTATDLYLIQGGVVNASTFGQGDAGAITIFASETISADGETQAGNRSGIGSEVAPTAVGNSGGINLTTANLSLTQGGRVSASTFGQGNAGALAISASETISANGEDQAGFSSAIVSQVAPTAVGNSGGINLTTANLSLTQGGQVSTSTGGQGNAGTMVISTSETISVDGENQAGFSSGITSQVIDGVGNSGGIKITTANLSLTRGGQVSTSTFGQGNAGALAISASETISVDGEDRAGFNSGIFSAVQGVGTSGGINLTTDKLSLTRGGEINASTDGRGDAGAITIKVSDTISADGETQDGFASGIFSRVEESGVGNAGGINLTTAKLSLTHGAQISVESLGQAKAGNLTVTSKTLEASSGGQLQSSTSGNFDAGNITLKVADSINLTGESSGIFANTQEESTGNGGNIFIDPNTVIIRDGAQVAVNSFGSGIGGNIDLQADSLTLDRGTITAETDSNQGGDINLTISDLLKLRNNSQLTATAGTSQAGGDGGNIQIDAPFIIAFPQENNDITANAFKGDGGNITINTNGIFGIEFRERETPLSDITASSEFGQQGEVEINTSAIDPTRGLDNLPQEAVEAKVAQSCHTVGGRSTLEFFDIGRGGLPPNPDDLFSSETVISEWIPLDLTYEKKQASTSENSFTGNEVKNMTLLTAFLCQSN